MSTEHDDDLIPIADDEAMGDGAGRRTRGRRIKAGLLDVFRINGRLYTTEQKRQIYINRLLAASHGKLDGWPGSSKTEAV
jgi:hypothetical protein